MIRLKCAEATFEKGFSCSQAIFACYSSELGLDRKTALKVAAAFGGGMACMGMTCGAVTGAYMVIGLKYGAASIEDPEAKERTYKLVRDFTSKFKEIHGSITCRELIGCDLNTPKGRALMKEKNLIATRCVKFVNDAAEILEEML